MTKSAQIQPTPSLGFASVQDVDKMSNRHAKTITENATAKQRPVRQLRAHHISQSSSSSSMNIRQDSAR